MKKGGRGRTKAAFVVQDQSHIRGETEQSKVQPGMLLVTQEELRWTELGVIE